MANLTGDALQKHVAGWINTGHCNTSPRISCTKPIQSVDTNQDLWFITYAIDSCDAPVYILCLSHIRVKTACIIYVCMYVLYIYVLLYNIV